MTSELMDAVESLGRAVAAPRVTDNGQGLPTYSLQHVSQRQGDEWACNCGRRWGADEPNPHGR